MDNDNPIKAILVVMLTALVCSVLVTLTAVKWQPIQQAYQNLDRNRALVEISGLIHETEQLTNSEVISLLQKIEARVVNLGTGETDLSHNPKTFDGWLADNNPELSEEIPTELDLAKLKHRSRLVNAYLIIDSENGQLKRLVLPIYGKGMWSKIFGFIAVENDLNTIAGITFYQQTETAGIGDKILDPNWQKSWRGRKLFDENNTLLHGGDLNRISPSELGALHQIDAISGATVTVDAVKDMVRYWFGPHGYINFLVAFHKELQQ